MKKNLQRFVNRNTSVSVRGRRLPASTNKTKLKYTVKVNQKMKPLAPYFGNRFAAVPAKKSKRQTSEMEALESRVLLSGIVADGSKSYKKLTYTDLEGDKVTVSLTKGTFTITGVNGDGNELISVDNINIATGSATSNLKISVAKVKPTSDGDGYTNIGQITASAAVTALKSISLDGAAVADVSLATTSVTNMTLKASAANILDRTSPAGYDGMLNVNWGTVTANSLGTIQSAAYGVTDGLDFNGNISVASGALKIIGLNSDLNGQVSAPTITNVNVKTINGGLTTTGDLTLNVNDGQTLKGTFTVGEDLHLTVLNGGLSGATFNVTGNISGAAAGDADVVKINGNVAGNTVGDDFVTFSAGGNFAGLTVVGGSILDGGGADVLNISAGAGKSIGAINVAGGSAYIEDLSFTTDLGTIGAITVRDGLTINGTVNATSIGNISGADVTLGGITLSGVLGSPSVGTVTATGYGAAEGDFAGTITATLGTIGNIDIKDDLVSGGFIASKGSFGSVNIDGDFTAGEITAAYVGTPANATIGAMTIGSMNGAATISAAGAVTSLAIEAGGINTGAGSYTVGSITGVLSVVGDISDDVTTTVGGIGSISVTVDTVNSELGDVTGNIVSAGAIAGTIGIAGSLTGIITATTGNIGNITVGGTVTTTITATAGNIGTFTGTSGENAVLNLVAHQAANSTIGAIAFNSLANNNSLTLDVSNATLTGTFTANTVGNISVNNAAGATAGDLILTDLANVTLIDGITVDGELDVTGATLTSVATLASLTAGSLTVTGTQIVIGNSAAVGTTAGSINITGDLADILAGGTLNDSQYRFNFDSYTATPDGAVAGVNTTAATTGAWGYGVNATGNSALGGISFIIA